MLSWFFLTVASVRLAQANRCDPGDRIDPTGGYRVPDITTAYQHVTTCQALGTNAGQSVCEGMYTEGPLGETAPCVYTPDDENNPEGPGTCAMLEGCFEFEPLSTAQWQFIDQSATSSCIPYSKNPCFITDQLILMYWLNPNDEFTCTEMPSKPWTGGGGPGIHYRGFPDVGQHLTAWIRSTAEVADAFVPYFDAWEGIEKKPSELMQNVTVTHAMESLPLPPTSMNPKSYKRHPLWKNQNSFITPTADCQECKLTFSTDFGERSVCCPWLIGGGPLSYQSLEDCNLHLQADDGIVFFYNIDHPDLRDEARSYVDWQPRTHWGTEAAMENFEIYYALGLLFRQYVFDSDGNYDSSILEGILNTHPDVPDDVTIQFFWPQEATASTSNVVLPDTFAPTSAPSTLNPTCYPSYRPTLHPTDYPTFVPSFSPSDYPSSMPSPCPTLSPTEPPTNSPTESPTDAPTESPTASPTPRPIFVRTPAPTGVDPIFPTPQPAACQHTWHIIDSSGYVERTQADSYATDCRQGIPTILGWAKEGWKERSYTWPLSLSPIDKTRMEYAVGQYCTVETQSGGVHSQKRNPYMTCVSKVDDTGAPLAITVDECFELCGKDQRCRGIEFPADGSECRIIDDVEDIVPNYEPLPNVSGTPAVQCFSKTDQCNPSFEFTDLTDELISCYCHNQSHGFLTKNVERTVEASRFCGSQDTDEELALWIEETEAIRRAQANRMFHLCDAWCLFDVDNPRDKFWFYNPRKLCWSKQGTKSYCYREHVAKNSIEFQYVVSRANKMCGRTNDIPTFAPTTRESDVTWIVEKGPKKKFCHTVCEDEGMTCSAGDFHLLFNNQIYDHPERVREIYRSAGVECTELAEGISTFVNPSFHPDTGLCTMRHAKKNMNNPCRGKLRGGFLRICPCV